MPRGQSPGHGRTGQSAGSVRATSCRIAVCPVAKIDQTVTATTRPIAPMSVIQTAASGQLSVATSIGPPSPSGRTCAESWSWSDGALVGAEGAGGDPRAERGEQREQSEPRGDESPVDTGAERAAAGVDGPVHRVEAGNRLYPAGREGLLHQPRGEEGQR